MGDVTKFPGKTQQEIKDSVNIQELIQFITNLQANIESFGGILIKGKDETFVPENVLLMCFNETTMMPIGHKEIKARELLTMANWCADQLNLLEEQYKEVEENKDSGDEV